MRVVSIGICLVFGAATGTVAQTIEVGGTVAAACVGSEGSICADAPHQALAVGAHSSWWVADRVELGARIARMGVRPYSRRSGAPDVRVVVTDRSREFVSFLFIYHFLRGDSVRPMLGLGSGWFAETERVTCEMPGCEARLPRWMLGDRRKWRADAIFLVGLSGIARERWVWRAGWHSHRFGNEEGSTEEFFVGVGYRFGSP